MLKQSSAAEFIWLCRNQSSVLVGIDGKHFDRRNSGIVSKNTTAPPILKGVKYTVFKFKSSSFSAIGTMVQNSPKKWCSGAERVAVLPEKLSVAERSYSDNQKKCCSGA